MKLPDGSVKFPDGRLQRPDGTFARPSPDGSYLLSDGSTLLPNGVLKLPNGHALHPDGSLRLPDGSVKLPDGTLRPAGHQLPSYNLPCFSSAISHQRRGEGMECGGCGGFVTGTSKLGFGKVWHPQCFVCCQCHRPFEEDDYSFVPLDGLPAHPECATKHVCAGCNKPIVGTVLKADLLDGAWHPECFRCSRCSQPISTTDGVLSCVMEDGKAVCDTCRTRRTCAACLQEIDGQAINAMESSWHPECFNCSKCKQAIGTEGEGGSFKIEDGQPVCERCRERVWCSSCGEEIEGQAITALDTTWHPRCFTCSKCADPIDTGSFKIEDGKPVCDRCRKRVVCAACNLEIDGQALTALGTTWHTSCFKCSKCTQPIATGGGRLSCVMEKGKPVCNNCRVRHQCAQCKTEISGQVMTALGKKWHPACFSCNHCKKKITGSFFHKDGVPYCSQDCYPK
eukprot:NODE_1420_length_1512_cov_52.905415_g1345_i0.p1 GENE.NODE_1420_length_1512_cov_52.905415_g1345_i0~~NODE_1420_length_1512_cov_52.905415_g1345_i0.p1  ORF type:complete len:467 (+),score=93.91 NODE_1420_length_1512_cov_52.905415_g1345_i0:45-1403(+)